MLGIVGTRTTLEEAEQSTQAWQELFDSNKLDLTAVFEERTFRRPSSWSTGPASVYYGIGWDANSEEEAIRIRLKYGSEVGVYIALLEQALEKDLYFTSSATGRNIAAEFIQRNVQNT